MRPRSLVTALIGLAAVFSAAGRPAADPCSGKRETVDFGEVVRAARTVSAHNPTVSVPQPGARHLRLRLSLREAGSCPWKLVIRDGKFRPVQTLVASDFPQGRSLWSTRVSGERAYLDLIDCENPSQGPSIHMAEYIWLPANAPIPFYSTKSDQPDWRPLDSSAVTAHEDRRLGDSVGMLVGVSTVRPRNWSCSGVVIGDGLFLTNWHCIAPLPDREPASMQGLLIDMSWDGDSVSQDYQVLKFEDGSPEIDFAILAIEPLGRGVAFRPAALRTSPPALAEVRLVHHPESQQKMMSFEGCRIMGLNVPDRSSPFLSHTCDTAGGSSGSPLFDGDGKVTGLHFCGFDKTAPGPRVNGAVRTDAIIRCLEGKKRTDLLSRIRH